MYQYSDGAEEHVLIPTDTYWNAWVPKEQYSDGAEKIYSDPQPLVGS